ncbi:MAG: hypothetical protein HZA36_02810 [Parcubacteria group bacterium]|nr:hypothetical protein [Parcubacteria group bacterium]
MNQGDRVKKLNQLWCELMRKKPDVATLETVLRRIPELKEKAARAMLKNNLSRHQLFSIVIGVPVLAERAARRLFPKEVSSYDLILIMEHVPRLRGRVWKQFCNTNPTNEVLRDALHHLPEFRKRIIRILLARNIDEYVLLAIFGYVTSKRMIRHVTERILNNPTVSRRGFLGIIENSTAPLRKKAAERVLSMNVFAEDLFVIMKFVPSLRMHAWKKLIADHRGEVVSRIIQRIVREIPRLRVRAETILRTPHFLVQEMLHLSQK